MSSQGCPMFLGLSRATVRHLAHHRFLARPHRRLVFQVRAHTPKRTLCLVTFLRLSVSSVTLTERFDGSSRTLSKESLLLLHLARAARDSLMAMVVGTPSCSPQAPTPRSSMVKTRAISSQNAHAALAMRKWPSESLTWYRQVCAARHAAHDSLSVA